MGLLKDMIALQPGMTQIANQIGLYKQKQKEEEMNKQTQQIIGDAMSQIQQETGGQDTLHSIMADPMKYYKYATPTIAKLIAIGNNKAADQIQSIFNSGAEQTLSAERNMIGRLNAGNEARSIKLNEDKFTREKEIQDSPVSISGSTRTLPSSGIVDSIINIESSGIPDAVAPITGARGLGQFTKSTWLDVTKKWAKDKINGKSDDEIWDMAFDKDLNRSMTEKFTQSNIDSLKSNGIPITPGSVYLAHFLGTQGAINLLKADKDADVSSVVSNSAIQANKSILKGKVKDVIDWAEDKMKDTNQSDFVEANDGGNAPIPIRTKSGEILYLNAPKGGWTAKSLEAAKPLIDAQSAENQYKDLYDYKERATKQEKDAYYTSNFGNVLNTFTKNNSTLGLPAISGNSEYMSLIFNSGKKVTASGGDMFANAKLLANQIGQDAGLSSGQTAGLAKEIADLWNTSISASPDVLTRVDATRERTKESENKNYRDLYSKEVANAPFIQQNELKKIYGGKLPTFEQWMILRGYLKKYNFGADSTRTGGSGLPDIDIP